MVTLLKSRNALLLLLLMAIAPGADARQAADSIEDLQSIIEFGSAIRIRDVAGSEVSGTVVELSPTTIGVFGGGVRRNFQPSEVDEIWQRRGDSLKNGTLWGLLIGTGIGTGFGIAMAADGWFGGEAIFGGAAVGAVLGTGSGILIDVLRKENQLIYGAREERAFARPVREGFSGMRVAFRF